MTVLDGQKFKDLFIAGSKRLDDSKDYLNSINVFPVPDADTGSNMASTLNTAVDALHELDDHSLPIVLETIARQLRMEAKGNSGIILSEFFHGMFKNIKHEDSIGPDDFKKALSDGKDAAYSALAEPKEGTILTLIRQAVEDLDAAQVEIADMKKILEHMVDSQKRALEETPELMPLLKENNVVDSGAHGFLLFWEGALAYMNGDIDHVILKPIRRVFTTDKTADITYRYCTEALVRGASFDKNDLQSKLMEKGDSLIITGDGELLKIHIHTNEPTVVLDFMGGLGTLVKTKVDDMKSQHQDKVENEGKQEIRIAADSTCDLDLALREEYDIEMIPLQIMFGDETYRDRVDMTADEFYTRIKSSKVMPKTSLPKGSDYVKGFEHISPHCEKILAIFVSSGISGTWQAGKKWGDDFDANEVVAYDSGAASLGQGLMAIEASKMAKDGKSMEEIVARLDEIKDKLKIYLTVDTLEFLEKKWTYR